MSVFPMNGNDLTKAARPALDADRNFEQQLRDMNEALLISSVKQHELIERAERAETALRESEGRVRLALDSAGLGTFNIDPATNTLTSDARFQTIFGSTGEQLGCEQALAIIHPADRRRIRAAVAAATRLDDPVSYQAEYRVVHPDGSVRWVSATGRTNVTDRKSAPKRLSFNGTVADITARKAAADALRQSQSRLRHAATAARLTYVEVDLRRGGAQTADNFTTVMGYAPPSDQEADGSVRHRVLLEHVVPDDRPSVLSALQHFLDGKPVGKVAYRVRGDDRIERWIESMWSIEYAEDGTPMQAFATHLDITDRRSAEDALQASEHRLRFVLDSMPQKIFTAEPTGDVDYFNPQWMEFTGLSFEQIKGWGWKQFIHPADVEENVRIWQHAVDTGEAFQCEHRFRRADGEYRWHVSRALPMRDKAGQVVMWVGANTDVHDLSQAEQALRSSEVRYRRLFETATDGLIILDATTGIIIDANAVTSELLGREFSELVGKQLHEIGFFLDRAGYSAAMEALREKGHVRHDSLPVRHRSGQTTQVEFVSNAYQVDQRVLAQCNLRDISMRAALEQQIKQQALNLAEQDRRKDEFMAMLSHELRNPLAPIRTAMQILRLQADGTENAIQQQARTVIERQVGTLTRLVDDLMEVSRVVSGKIRLVMVPVDLCEALRHALDTVIPVMEHRRQHVSVALPDGPVWVNADPIRLEQIIVNLMNNAAKFTDEGGHVELSVGNHHEQGELRVRDSGIGIAPEMLEHVFDLFAQADRSLARSEGGLGIGLGLVQRLVTLHGGTVEARSAGIHQGSEFIVRLPVAPAPGELSDQATSALEECGTKTLRVLVVDDNIDGCTMLAAFVGLKGYAVETASSGPAALAAATDWRPDVVLLDIGLPGLSGFDVASRLRTDPANKAMKLIAVSGYGREQDLGRGREAGFDFHLIKPIDLTVVEQLLTTWDNQR